MMCKTARGTCRQCSVSWSTACWYKCSISYVRTFHIEVPINISQNKYTVGRSAYRDRNRRTGSANSRKELLRGKWKRTMNSLENVTNKSEVQCTWEVDRILKLSLANMPSLKALKANKVTENIEEAKILFFASWTSLQYKRTSFQFHS